ncbi:MAG: hypothetical protein ACOC97_06305 [Myxococcota bacterium]
MRRSPVPPLLVLLLGLVCASCGDEDPNVQSFSLSGRVTDRATGDGIGGVTVTFVSDTLHEAQDTTGSGGSYSVMVRSDTPFGQVRADKDGWLSDEKTVYFDVPERRVDLSLRRAADE